MYIKYVRVKTICDARFTFIISFKILLHHCIDNIFTRLIDRISSVKLMLIAMYVLHTQSLLKSFFRTFNFNSCQ